VADVWEVSPEWATDPKSTQFTFAEPPKNLSDGVPDISA
jgi:hypothetical protein